VVLVVTGCGSTAKPSPPQVRLTPQVARELDGLLRHELDVSAVPGISAAIVFPDGRVWARAVGAAVTAPRVPMTTRTTLAFDSITKIATAALALRLLEQGKLRLDDPIRRWYPSWHGDRRATVRDLLGHTSGAGDPRQRFFESLIRHPRRDVTTWQYLAATPKPGPRTAGVRYSNAGFLIAGSILERAAGEPLATAMRRELFGHPGGEGLALQPAEQPHPPRVHAYWYPHGGGEPADASDGGPILPYRAWANSAVAAAGLAGDVPSLARWAHELLGGRILKAASLREMTRFHNGQFWPGYGLGLASDSANGVELWGHAGDGLGSHTELWHAPRERITVVMSWNDANFETDPGFLRALLHAALG
jgi:CubicO group peptidase (beta-lactamase class C family)